MSVSLEDNLRKNCFKKNVPIDQENGRTTQQKLLHSIAISEGFSNYDIEQTPISNTGGNFLGILFHATIRGERFKLREELRLFVKQAAESKALRNLFPLHDVYCNEMFVYKTLSRIYNNLQVDENVPEIDRFQFTKFYGSTETDFTETIVLDDLSFKKYNVQDRFVPITLEYAKNAVNNLAKFHALSYVLERRDPDYFEEFVKSKKGNMYLDGNGRERIKKGEVVMTKNALQYLENKEYSERLQHFCKNMAADVGNYVKVNRCQVLCHGDYRVNNILVKYENERITSLIPIDYQLIHYGSPLNDLFYFIFGATDQAFRSNQFDYVVEFYYSCLGEFLGKFSYDVSNVYPKSEFDDDVKSHIMFGLVMAVNILPFLLVSEQDAPDLAQINDETMEQLGNSAGDVFKKRFNEIIEEFVKWGYL